MRTFPRRIILNAAASSHTCRVIISVSRRTSNGSSVGLVGSSDAVGNWDTRKGLRLSKTREHVWYGEVEIPAGQLLEYKFFIQSADGDLEGWQPGNNLLLQVTEDAESMLITDNWSGSERVTRTFLKDDDPFASDKPNLSSAEPSNKPVDETNETSTTLKTESTNEAASGSRDVSQNPGAINLATEANEGANSQRERFQSALSRKEAASVDPARKDSQKASDPAKPQVSQESKIEDFTAPSLKKKTVKELRALLKERGLPSIKGLKAELIQALLEWQALHK